MMKICCLKLFLHDSRCLLSQIFSRNLTKQRKSTASISNMQSARVSHIHTSNNACLRQQKTALFFTRRQNNNLQYKRKAPIWIQCTKKIHVKIRMISDLSVDPVFQSLDLCMQVVRVIAFPSSTVSR